MNRARFVVLSPFQEMSKQSDASFCRPEKFLANSVRIVCVGLITLMVQDSVNSFCKDEIVVD